MRTIIQERRGDREPRGGNLNEIVVDGRRRTYLVHLPRSYDKSKRLPLVLAFHGGGGNAQNMAKMSGFNEKADKENFIVVYPNGSGRFDNMLLTFNAIGCCDYAMETNIDDVKFVSLLIDKLIKDYAVDKKRVYATGFSNGALISYRLAAEIPDKIAAIAPVAGALFDSSPKAKGKVAVLVIHGLADTAVPYEGGTSQRDRITKRQNAPFKSVAFAANFWARNNGCKDKPIKTNEPKVIRERYSGCEANNDVEVISIVDGLHSWPSGEKGREAADEPSTAINATDEIWKFFKDHKKP
ncbi:MAG: polyhydroxybutyrate depolymerase [Acidobacteria bacterium]|nr:polyhydroxybutyrate depolymerase [Acidobacteriota bacterium]